MPNEVSALLEIAGETLDRAVISPAETLHGAIARRVFTAVGPAALPVRLLHDGIAGLSYSTVRAATRVGAAAGAAVARTATGDDLRPLDRRPRGRLAVGALNALVGDLLEVRGNALAIEMSVRRGGADVPPRRAALAAAFRPPRRRLVVLLHGLAETEEWWRHRGRHDFGAALERDLRVSAVEVRYNTGLSVAENGARLASLLDALVRAWPVPVRDLAIVGHSMGGLVARAATRSGGAFTERLSRLVTLGTPHTGAPLEKAVHLAARLLRTVPEAVPVADVLDLRSEGIRDLRLGDPTDWRLPGCTHTFVTATVTQDPDQPWGRIAGDLLVRTDSAAGRHRTRRVAVPEDQVVHIGGLNHFDLLDHGAVYDCVREVLGSR